MEKFDYECIISLRMMRPFHFSGCEVKLNSIYDRS